MSQGVALHLSMIPGSPFSSEPQPVRLPRLSLSSPLPQEALVGEGRGAERLKIAATAPAMSLLEGSVEPNMGEEASGGGRSGEGRNQPELELAVSTPRATVPGCRVRRVRKCRDIWTQTPRNRWTR